ncbi:MAG TPA: hypothetical protein GX731_02190 [Clostridiales bacterium]|nr:hypothetical protein [Clostridiales bacterium]
MSKVISSPLPHIFLAYLKLVSVTGRFQLINGDLIKDNAMVGYWHGDSYCMQLVLAEIGKNNKRVNVIVTADKRGDIIEDMIKSKGARALRLPDGMKMRPFYRKLKEFAIEEEGILAASLDGPLGPLHEPKKLIFLLATEAKKPLAYIHFKYKRVMRLNNRWDKYVIPLPFSRITAVVEDLGIISNDDVREFEHIKQKLKC